MNLDFFLWPMLLPFFIPIIYSLVYSKKDIKSVLALFITALVIVLFYPMLSSIQWFGIFNYAIWKTVFFILIPISIIFTIEKGKMKNLLSTIGLQKIGLKKSLTLSLIAIPVMIGITFLIYVIGGFSSSGDVFLGILSFFESFTEEVYFRGLLLLYLWKKTSLPIAYVTASASFVLHHPQHFQSLFLITTIVQALLTAEIARRSKNIIGSWVVHGTNRLVSIALLPFIL